MRKARITAPHLSGPLTATVLADGEKVAVGGQVLGPQEFSWQPPITGLVYGLLLNDRTALEQLGDKLLEPPYKALPKAPALYIKPYNTQVGHLATVQLPKGAGQVEVGGTLGLVIAETACRVSESQAYEVIGGYTVVIDLSLPHQSLYRPPIREKCFDGACPIGPWVVDRKDLSEPAQVVIRTYVNNEARCSWTLANLIRNIPQLIADVTEFITLLPGDVLLVGLPPEIPMAKAGDQLAVEISGIGRLECRLAADEERQTA